MHGHQTTILLSESDDQRRLHLSGQLAADGHEVVAASGDQEARVKARNHRPGALVLGAGDTPVSALILLDDVRRGSATSAAVPRDAVAIVTGIEGEVGRIRALDRGADDAVGPNCSYPELRARLHATLRRAHGGLADRRLRHGDLVLDEARRSATYRDRDLALSALEFSLLARLLAEPERVVPKAELLADVWGIGPGLRTRTLEAHACRLRNRLAAVGAEGFVVNTRGVGYALSRSIVTGKVVGFGERGVRRAA